MICKNYKSFLSTESDKCSNRENKTFYSKYFIRQTTSPHLFTRHRNHHHNTTNNFPCHPRHWTANISPACKYPTPNKSCDGGWHVCMCDGCSNECLWVLDCCNSRMRVYTITKHLEGHIGHEMASQNFIFRLQGNRNGIWKMEIFVFLWRLKRIIYCLPPSLSLSLSPPHPKSNGGRYTVFRAKQTDGVNKLQWAIRSSRRSGKLWKRWRTHKSVMVFMFSWRALLKFN